MPWQRCEQKINSIMSSVISVHTRAGLGPSKDAYMSVLYPKAIGKPEWYPLFSSGTKAYAQNAGLDRDKKGMVTVADAVSMVQRRSGQAPATSVATVPSQDTVPQTQGFTAQEGMPEPSTQGADWANLLFSDTGTGGSGARRRLE